MHFVLPLFSILVSTPLVVIKTYVSLYYCRHRLGPTRSVSHISTGIARDRAHLLTIAPKRTSVLSCGSRQERVELQLGRDLTSNVAALLCNPGKGIQLLS